MATTTKKRTTRRRAAPKPKAAPKAVEAVCSNCANADFRELRPNKEGWVCRRYPPTMVGQFQGAHPVVRADGWCAEHRAKGG